jgi:PKD repeat protein
MTGGIEDEAPMVPPFQVGVTNDVPYVSDYSIGFYHRQDGGGVAYSNITGTIRNNVGGDPIYDGTRYYAMITTNTAGTRTVEFTTTPETKAQKYTVRVERENSAAITRVPPLSANNAYFYGTASTGSYLSDEVDVNVEKGVVTPVANFVGTPTYGIVPLTVQFTDLSTNSPTSWNWNFGDWSSSILQNPSHTYTSNGTYPVALTATNLAGSNVCTRMNYISVPAVPDVDTVGVFRNGSFYLKDATAFGYGLRGDTAIAGNWIGIGEDTGGVFRNGSFYLKDNCIDTAYSYGLTGDKPVAGDWNGDRKTEVGVFRDGVFYLRDSTGGTYAQFGWGLTGDSPIAGDWDGDGKTEVGVFRNGSFYLRSSTGATYSAFGYGLTGDTPIAGKWT